VSSGIEKGENGNVLIRDADGTTQVVPYDKILIALGREMNIKGLDLEKAGIISDKGISVNDYNQTNVPHIFAIGDCVEGNPQFTHLANNEGR